MGLMGKPGGRVYANMGHIQKPLAEHTTTVFENNSVRLATPHLAFEMGL
jgi:hypothetical protein